MYTRFDTSTVADGNMSYRFGDQPTVEANRRRFLGARNLRLEDCVVPALSHDDLVAVVGEEERGRGALDGESGIRAEALITASPGTALFLMTADCFPVVLSDPGAGVVALAHCGWRPTGLRLAAKTVREMGKSFGCNPKSVYAHVGPGIRKESYRFRNPAQAALPQWRPYLEELGSGEVAIDLPSFLIDQLLESGVPLRHISCWPEDTAKSERLFSHYRAQRTGETEGRFVTVAWVA